MSNSKAKAGPWSIATCALLLAGCGAPGVGNATTEVTSVTNAAAAAPATLPPPAPGVNPRASPSGRPGALPADVRAFKAKRDQCDHFRGEEPTDPARARELERKLEQSCTGTDAALAALRKRYAGNVPAIAALKEYDDAIE